MTSGQKSDLTHAQLVEAATCPVGEPILFSSRQPWLRK